MSESHIPRQETEDERQAAYRQLRKSIKRGLFSVPELFDKDANKKAKLDVSQRLFPLPTGGKLNLMRNLVRNPHGLLEYDIVAVIIHHNSYNFGPRTIYIAIDNGPFLRHDENPLDAGYGKFLSMPKSTQEERLEATLAYKDAMAASLEARRENQALGIGSQPTTAEETHYVRGLVEGVVQAAKGQ